MRRSSKSGDRFAAARRRVASASNGT